MQLLIAFLAGVVIGGLILGMLRRGTNYDEHQ